jgi:hypothetical protein
MIRAATPKEIQDAFAAIAARYSMWIYWRHNEVKHDA